MQQASPTTPIPAVGGRTLTPARIFEMASALEAQRAPADVVADLRRQAIAAETHGVNAPAPAFVIVTTDGGSASARRLTPEQAAELFLMLEETN